MPHVPGSSSSEIHVIHVWQAMANVVCQRAGRRETAFAIRLKRDDAPAMRGEGWSVAAPGHWR
jgi:hypothetical protein